jgi:hypothetical protein
MPGRLPLLALAVTLLVLGGAGPAAADVTSTLTLSNDISGTLEHPRPVQIGLNMSTTTPFPSEASGAWATSVALGLGDFLTVDSATDQTCPYGQVFQDETQCPVGSQVAEGTMDLLVPGGNEHLTLKVFDNGTRYVVLFTGQTPLSIRDVVNTSLQDGPLTFDLPSSVGRPGDRAAYVIALTMRLGLDRPGSAGWIFTNRCTPFGWDVNIMITASNGDTLSAGSRHGCAPGSYISPSVTLDDTVSGTAGAPKPTGATIAFAPQPAFPENWIGRLNAVRLSFGPGVALGTAPTAPSCTAAQVGTDDAACPPGSRVGGGMMHEGVDIPLTAYNAPGGRSVNVLALAPSRYVLVGTLDDAGRSLTLPIPTGISVPQPGGWVGVASFTLKLGDDSPISWLHTVGCPSPWAFEVALDGGLGWETGRTSVACSTPHVGPQVGPKDEPRAPGPQDPGTSVPKVSPPVIVTATAKLVARFLPTFVTSGRRHGKVLGTFYGLAGLDEAPVGGTVDILCVRGCKAARSFAISKALTKRKRLLLRRPVAVTARTIVEVRVRRGADIGRSARFTFQRVHSLLLAHRIASGCVTSRPPVKPTPCTATA